MYFRIAASLILLGGMAFLSRTVVARQMDRWQITPQPERSSELYFADYRQLPRSYRAGNAQKFAFTVRNLERQTTTYRYRLVAASSDNSQQQLGVGMFTLADDASRTTNQSVVIPALGPRVAVMVNLEYTGISAGNNKPTPQTQSITYWVTNASEKKKAT